MKQSPIDLVLKPLTQARWHDLETLFNLPGECRSCWCMWWRLKRKDFEANGAAGNKRAMKGIVESGEVPGLLAYRGNEPAAWVSVAPRERFPVLDRSPMLKRVDDRPAWSIVCFFAAEKERGRGITEFLIRGAVDYVRSRGGTLIEAYPALPEDGKMPKSRLYTGTLSTYIRLGFTEAAHRGESRCILRLET